MVSSTKVLVILIHTQKNEAGIPALQPQTKGNPKSIEDLNVRAKTMKLIKTGINLPDLRFHSGFYGMTSKAHARKESMKSTSSKLKCFVLQRTLLSKKMTQRMGEIVLYIMHLIMILCPE